MADAAVSKTVVLDVRVRLSPRAPSANRPSSSREIFVLASSLLFSGNSSFPVGRFPFDIRVQYKLAPHQPHHPATIYVVIGSSKSFTAASLKVNLRGRFETTATRPLSSRSFRYFRAVCVLTSACADASQYDSGNPPKRTKMRAKLRFETCIRSHAFKQFLNCLFRDLVRCTTNEAGHLHRPETQHCSHFRAFRASSTAKPPLACTRPGWQCVGLRNATHCRPKAAVLKLKTRLSGDNALAPRHEKRGAPRGAPRGGYVLWSSPSP